MKHLFYIFAELCIFLNKDNEFLIHMKLGHKTRSCVLSQARVSRVTQVLRVKSLEPHDLIKTSLLNLMNKLLDNISTKYNE